MFISCHLVLFLLSINNICLNVFRSIYNRLYKLLRVMPVSQVVGALIMADCNCAIDKWDLNSWSCPPFVQIRCWRVVCQSFYHVVIRTIEVKTWTPFPSADMWSLCNIDPDSVDFLFCHILIPPLLIESPMIFLSKMAWCFGAAARPAKRVQG